MLDLFVKNLILDYMNEPVCFASGQVTLPEPYPNIFAQPMLNTFSKNNISKAIQSMCHNPKPKSLHLVTAVIDRIAHFNALKVNFSAYDITRAVREKLEDGQYELVDVLDKGYFNGKTLPIVEHSTVRSVVKELFDLKLIPNFTPTNHFDSQVQNSYVLYKYEKDVPGPNFNLQNAINQADVAAKLPAVDAKFTASTANLQAAIDRSAVGPMVALTGLTNPLPKPVTVATKFKSLKTPTTAMWDKVVDYADTYGANCPSIKKLQSRLKGWKVTCKELANFLDSKGFVVRKDSGTDKNPSKWTISY